MKKIMITITIIMIIMISGCRCSCESVGEKTCSSLKDEKDRGHCYQSLAVKTKNMNYCNDIPKTAGGQWTKCFILLGQKMHNPELCKMIPENSLPPQYTREQCYQAVAVESGKPGYCEEIGSFQGMPQDISKGLAFSKEICKTEATKNKEIEPECGELYNPCCPGETCKEEHYNCYGYKCRDCGTEGRNCCDDKDVEPCKEGLKCNKKMQSCEKPNCGQLNQQPCSGNTCFEGLTYVSSKNKCADCGVIGKKCCEQEPRCSFGTCKEGMCIEN